MGIADPEAALEKLREFLILLRRADHYSWSDDVPRSIELEIDHMMPLVKAIARAVDREEERGLSRSPVYSIGATTRLIGRLERHEDFRRILGPAGPTLAANRLHPWVWEAAASLWDDGYYGKAVEDAYNKVERETQQSVGRLDLSGKKLYSNVFSTKEPTARMPRLRFPHLDENKQPDDWTSAHEGAMHLGMGCAQGIRNPQAHPSNDITEQEALEQLAALSVLARWVAECDVDSAADDAAGE